MNRLLLIARHEYARHVRRKGFLLTTLGLPLLLIGSLVVLLIMLLGQPERAIGYVDRAGLFGQPLDLPAFDREESLYVPLRPYESEEAARAALDAQAIDAYLVIPPAYPAQGDLVIYSRGDLSMFAERSIERALAEAFAADLPPDVAARVIEPIAALTMQAIGRGRVMGPESGLLLLMPLLFGLLFMIAVFFSSGYLLQALVEEKENRTMEILMTSVLPWQVIGGKVLGLGLLGLTQVLIWACGGGVLWAVAAAQLEEVRSVAVPVDLLGVAALFFVAGYLLYAGCMVGIGAIVTSVQEGQQIGSLFSLLALLPFMVNFLFISDPNGTLPLALSLFPLSAPLAMVMRLPLAEPPAWQVLLSLAIVALSAAFVIWLAARLFRMGMLRYGKRLGVADVIAVLRGVSRA